MNLAEPANSDSPAGSDDDDEENDVATGSSDAEEGWESALERGSGSEEPDQVGAGASGDDDGHDFQEAPTGCALFTSAARSGTVAALQ